jgi:hypothetical protein
MIKLCHGALSRIVFLQLFPAILDIPGPFYASLLNLYVHLDSSVIELQVALALQFLAHREINRA